MGDDDTDANVYQLRQPEDLLAAYRNTRRPEIDDLIAQVKAVMDAADLIEAEEEATAAGWRPYSGDPYR